VNDRDRELVLASCRANVLGPGLVPERCRVWERAIGDPVIDPESGRDRERDNCPDWDQATAFPIVVTLAAIV
jgi:hypothetical protein